MGKKKEVAITAVPSVKVSNLAKPTRKGTSYSSSWKVPNDALNEKKKNRYQHQLVKWQGYTIKKETSTKTVSKSKAKKIPKKKITKKNGVKTVTYTTKENVGKKVKVTSTKTITYNKPLEYQYKKSAKTTSDSYKMKNRKKYWPFTNTRLGKVSVLVAGVNKKNYNAKTKKYSKQKWAVSPEYKFSKPRKPSMNSVSINLQTGTVSTTVESDAGADGRERYCTICWITRKDSFTKTKVNGKNKTGVEKIVKAKNKPDDGKTTSKTLSWDVEDWENFPTTGDRDGWIQITFHAFAQGLMGDSGTITRSHIFCWPARASITVKDIKYTSQASEYLRQITIPVVINQKDGKREVDTAQLQVVKGISQDMTAEQVALIADNEWEVLREDDGETKGFAINYDEADSPKDTYSWIRVKTIHDELSLNSKPVRLDGIFSKGPSVSGNKAEIISTVPGVDGVSMVLTLGWDSKETTGDEDATGVEISWSPNEDAWISTESPSLFLVNWTDPKITSDKWNKCAKLVVRGLEEGTPYYFRIRPYLEDAEGNITYGEYNDENGDTGTQSKVAPVSSPTEIQVQAPTFIPVESDLPINWTFTSPAQQSQWWVYSVVADNENQNDPWKASDIIASSNDSAGATTLKWLIESTENATVDQDAIQKKGISEYVQTETSQTGEESRYFRFKVGMTTGGDPIVSETKTVSIVEAPVISVSTTYTKDEDGVSIVEEQPLRFNVQGNASDLHLLTTIEAEGITFIDYEEPDFEDYQADGDIVYAETNIKVDWVASAEEGQENLYNFETVCPKGLDFFDNGAYTVYITAIDEETGLRSEEVSFKCCMKWSHQAEPPSDKSTAVGFSTKNGKNQMVRGCNIYLQPPENYQSTDVCEVYRVTPDGVYMIASNVNFYTDDEEQHVRRRTIVTDRYAPFSKQANLRYRIATRTADGDIESREIPYNIDCALMRFDWGNGNFVELPYNLKMSDSFAKDSEIRQHFNGDRMGVWNKGHSRTGNLSTDIIKVGDPETIEKIRNLAQYPGAVFVRTPDGCAYQADVQVNTIDWQYNNPVMAVSFTATEITLGADFMCSSGDITSISEPIVD